MSGPCCRRRQATREGFVDLQHDVKLSDVDQTHLEGHVSVEHLERYTTTDMATDENKLSNVMALARLAELHGRSIPEVDTAPFRPPYASVTIGAIPGHEAARHFRAACPSPIRGRDGAAGAALTIGGAWMRSHYFPRSGQTLREADIHEAAYVRSAVGEVDI